MDELNEERLRKCVFEQPYRKVGAKHFVRGQPQININLQGGDLPRQYNTPQLDPTLPEPHKLELKGTLVVRYYDRNAVCGKPDLLGNYAEAQAVCDEYLESFGVYLICR